MNTSSTGRSRRRSDSSVRISPWRPSKRNSGAVELTGYTEDEVRGQLADLIFTPEDRAANIPKREARSALRKGRARNRRVRRRPI